MTAATGKPTLDAAAFEALYLRLRQVPGWGPTDRRGALNHLTPERVRAASVEIKLGRTVSLAAPIETSLTPDDPAPAIHEMSGPPGDQADPRGLTFAQDRLGINVHSNVDSHIDALCHAMYRKTLYNGVPADAVTSRGAQELSIEVARDGIAGRGVLLDIPRLRGVPWLEPGDLVTTAELAAAAEAQQVSIGPGDLLFVRTGHRRRRDELGPWDAATARAGLHPEALEFIAERKVAVLGSDSNSDVAPASRQALSCQSTCSRLTRLASTCSTTCGSRTSCRSARRLAAGPSSALSPRCDCRTEPVPPSTRSRSCRPLPRRTRPGPPWQRC